MNLSPKAKMLLQSAARDAQMDPGVLASVILEKTLVDYIIQREIEFDGEAIRERFRREPF